MDAAFLLAHGAGAPSSSPWMVRWRGALETLGAVRAFDYEYLRAGRRAPSPLPRLIEEHRAELARLRAEWPGRVFLAGKSMGGRVGCHLALTEPVAGVICFGFPLRGQNGKSRADVLLELTAPILFVQGTRDPLCDLDELAAVRSKMRAPSVLHVVDGGDHSLELTARLRAELGVDQPAVDARILQAIGSFCAGAGRS